MVAMNTLLPQKIDDIKRLLRQGFGTRHVAFAVGCNKNTVAGYRRKMLTCRNNLKCPCGQPIGHVAWCSWRYKNSPRRQEFIKQWHNKTKRKAIMNATVKIETIGRE